MPAFLLPLLGAAGRAVLALAASPVGWCLAAFIGGWILNGHRVRAQWAEETAAEKAAYQREVARQETAAMEIAAEATKRLADEQGLARDLQAQIEAFDKEETAADATPPRTKPACTPAVIRPCVVDDAFAARLRELDATAARARAPARRARRVRRPDPAAADQEGEKRPHLRHGEPRGATSSEQTVGERRGVLG